MSTQNEEHGAYFYGIANENARLWLRRQLEIWPERADHNNTTNISFLYGAYRACTPQEQHDWKPSAELRVHFDALDRFRK